MGRRSGNVGRGRRAEVHARDVFVYFIHGGKIRAPAAAQAFIDLVGNPATIAKPARPEKAAPEKPKPNPKTAAKKTKR
jgi:hypothetical protein